MRKLTPRFILYLGIGILCFMIGFVIVTFLFQNRMEPGDAVLQVFDLKEKILIEIMNRNYNENSEFLLRAEINGEQVGIVYFDENGEIRFDGDKERFEKALYRAFKLREESWGYKREEK